jgi:hypothetical protein
MSGGRGIGFVGFVQGVDTLGWTPSIARVSCSYLIEHGRSERLHIFRRRARQVDRR